MKIFLNILNASNFQLLVNTIDSLESWDLEKKFFLISNLSVSWCNFRPSPLRALLVKMRAISPFWVVWSHAFAQWSLEGRTRPDLSLPYLCCAMTVFFPASRFPSCCPLPTHPPIPRWSISINRRAAHQEQGNCFESLHCQHHSSSGSHISCLQDHSFQGRIWILCQGAANFKI